MKKEGVYSQYNSLSKKMYLLIPSNSCGAYRKVEGKICVNHEKREIRLYDFNKTELSNEEKANIMFGILEELELFPNGLLSPENTSNLSVAQYVLLVNRIFA